MVWFECTYSNYPLVLESIMHVASVSPCQAYIVFGHATQLPPFQACGLRVPGVKEVCSVCHKTKYVCKTF